MLIAFWYNMSQLLIVYYSNPVHTCTRIQLLQNPIIFVAVKKVKCRVIMKSKLAALIVPDHYNAQCFIIFYTFNFSYLIIHTCIQSVSRVMYRLCLHNIWYMSIKFIWCAYFIGNIYIVFALILCCLSLSYTISML